MCVIRVGYLIGADGRVKSGHKSHPQAAVSSQLTQQLSYICFSFTLCVSLSFSLSLSSHSWKCAFIIVIFIGPKVQLL